ncbi:hypothetical protein [Paeniglutamicibacter psychrophenolicus]|uniref:hypothetical protein n=1 Tax=Paeniglutamicibacter psychrophenolicus TaxID=257454 RepID=UPI0027820F1F|nr:hypothetical protein [Paeniglutamicibacter psychrophenolicus]MDQ0095355.1 hypothetical protein [Paeniglutamicibacter psychrophenolicus]
MMNQPAPQSSRPAIPRRPISVLLISALLVLEGLAVLAYALTYALSLGQTGELGMGARIFMLVLIIAAGAWQLLVAHHFFRARAWTRAAVLVWQVFQIILALQIAMPVDVLVAWLWLVPAAVVVVLLFDPRTTAFLGDRPTTRPGTGNKP